MKRAAVVAVFALMASPSAAAPVTLDCAVTMRLIVSEIGKADTESSVHVTETFTLKDDGTFIGAIIEKGLEDHGNYTVTPKRYILRYTDNTMPETTGYIDRETGEFFNTHGFDNSQTVRLTTTNTGMCSPEVAKPKF